MTSSHQEELTGKFLHFPNGSGHWIQLWLLFVREPFLQNGILYDSKFSCPVLFFWLFFMVIGYSFGYFHIDKLERCQNTKDIKKEAKKSDLLSLLLHSICWCPSLIAFSVLDLFVCCQVCLYRARREIRPANSSFSSLKALSSGILSCFVWCLPMLCFLLNYFYSFARLGLILS